MFGLFKKAQQEYFFNLEEYDEDNFVLSVVDIGGEAIINLTYVSKKDGTLTLCSGCECDELQLNTAGGYIKVIKEK